MKLYLILRLYLIRSLVLVGCILLPTVVSANTDKATDLNVKRLQAGQKSQKKINQLNAETQKLLHEYRNTSRDVDNIAAYNQQLNEQLANQQLRLDELSQSLNKVNAIERDIQPLMARMLKGLERFIQLDIPFYKAERAQRLAHLKNNQERSDISVAEKFRQLLEAYEIEAEYGRSIDSYSDTISIDGDKKVVDILRVGRIALLYQSKDERYVGRWDSLQRQWQPLMVKTYGHAIKKGLKMARKQIAVSLLNIPVAAPVSVATTPSTDAGVVQ